MRAFTALAGEHVQVIGDDYLVTSADRISAAAAAGACNAVLLKPNQSGRSRKRRRRSTLRAPRAGRSIVSARSGETEDVTIVHLAVGWAAGQLKVGSCARSERTAKWNEALRIEEALGVPRSSGGCLSAHLSGRILEQKYQEGLGRGQIDLRTRNLISSDLCELKAGKRS